MIVWRHLSIFSIFFFFFNDTATTEIYTLSLHDALPICSLRDFQLRQPRNCSRSGASDVCFGTSREARTTSEGDRKSTRLNSSHANISYAVFCLKKKKKKIK